MRKITKQDVAYSSQAGFTIVELMIATTVFSVILVIITTGVLYFTRSYYKGVYASATQNAARNITESVMNAVRFGSGAVGQYDPATSPGEFFCAGGYVFVFKAGEKYTSDGTTTGMYMQPMPTADCGLPSGPDPKRQQLLGQNMRVTYIKFTGTAPQYTLDIRVAYAGEDDMLTAVTGPDVQCKPEAGSEYCSVTSLLSTAQQRVVK